jgi:catechol 2,3-dioxygenase-like lactoylglutathione lyase family enzyme
MKIVGIAGFAVIAKDLASSQQLYRDLLQLPLKEKDDYLSVDGFEGSKHFGVWSLTMAAQSCFGQEDWPTDLEEPQATIEFELGSVDAVRDAVEELKATGMRFVHEARLEPWGQTVARFMSPEGLLIGLSFAPWFHRKQS